MKVLVVGLGVQGNKRKFFAHDDLVACVDPYHEEAEYQSVYAVPLSEYEAVLLCVPDKEKYVIIRYLLENKKHVLVEKPLWVPKKSQLSELESLAKKNNVVLYTAYNHRFEPHFKRVRDFIQKGTLGKIYRCQLFYGNGTARLVRESEWRDQGAGVLADLGSHLLDTLAFWFDDYLTGFECIDIQRHENRAPDYALLHNGKTAIKFILEMSLLSWRNHFTCLIVGERGSIHVESLCKWGPARFIYRERVFPSGRPIENEIVLTQADPTWQEEYQHFLHLIQKKQETDLKTDQWLYQTLSDLTFELNQMVGETA